MKGIPVILRRLVGSRPCMAARISSSSSSSTEALMASSATAAVSYSTLILSDEIRKPLFNSAAVTPTISLNFPSTFLVNHSRSFTSDSSGSSNIVSIESEEQLNDSLRRAQDESIPTVFYFTAAWCGPCKFLSPFIGQLSLNYPNVTTYKIDIDKEGLANALSKLDINAVPTVHFFQNGKKVFEVVGADVEKLRSTMETLFK